MSKTTSTTSKKPKKSSTQKQPDQMSTAKANNKKLLETWKKDAEVLSYEESLQALDMILNELQDETVALDDLQKQYLHSKVYLEHCEQLLDKAQQSILELDPDSLQPKQ